MSDVLPSFDGCPEAAAPEVAPDVQRVAEQAGSVAVCGATGGQPVPDTKEGRAARRLELEEDAREIRRIELAATDSINADPHPKHVEAQLDQLGGNFLDYYKRKLPDTAEYDAARRLRLVPFRAIGHRLGMNVIPLVSDFLRPRSTIDERCVEGFMGPDAVLQGLNGRVHHGDEARLGAALYSLLHPVATQTICELPPAIHAAAVRTTVELKKQAADQLRKAQEAAGRYSSEHSPFAVLGDDDRRTYSQRFLEFQALRLPIDPKTMLQEGNLPSQIEHIISAVGDLYRGYEAAGAPSELQLPTSLGALRWFRMLASLRNAIGGRIEYQDRYVWKSSVGPGRRISKRQPLFSVQREDNGDWSVTATRAPFTAKLAERPGICPGKDVVTPTDEQRRRCDVFLRNVVDITGMEKFPDHLTRDGISSPDVLSAFSFIVVRRLRDAGIIRLTHGEFARYLGPAQRSDGAVFRA